MPRLPGGSLGRARLGVVLRTSGMVLGGLLGAAAIWLIVTTDSTKNVKLGVLLGLWGIVVAGFAAAGSRRHEASEAGGELVVRSLTGLDRLSDAAAVREYEQRLHAMLGHQIEQTLGAELASLRNEVASMRSELVEKVGGQLRLERIETTRLFGSDIEALQHEIQQLKINRAAAAPSTVVQAVTGRIDRLPPQRAATTRPAPPAFEVESPADLAPSPGIEAVARPEPPQPVVVAPEPPQPAPQLPVPPQPAPPQPAPQLPVPQPAAASASSAAGTPASSRWVAPATVSLPSTRPAAEATPDARAAAASPPAARPSPATPDPFAELPRLKPFTEFDLDPVDVGGTGALPEIPAQSPDPAERNDSESGGGRRRRDSDEGHDILSQILQREGQHR
ncbi:MAG: hypothetical protein QOE97_918 [Pseudonocardiales bacterium]|jgi:hypothetical protein|nr:hypothetical protein [Pseudonocardiales bacterium]